MQQTIEHKSLLMSAISVKEAREATLLAENVRSLTYVNIIFLPLSYCTSLWGMESGSNNGKLAWATVMVFLITCLAVTSLETTTRSFRKAWKEMFSLGRRPLIARMEKHRNWSWRKLAGDLERKTGPDEKPNTKPSTDPDKKHQSKPDVNVKQKSTATETPKSKNPMTVLRKLRPRSNKDIEKGNLPTEKTATSLTDKNATASSELEAKP
ncbi:hypothetical protein B0T09DRAFT_359304 [Sordaria sp. MPI-SDFR-AT-0083]|nr:hypothetical protein B0T09DRAFT_359304 [Sordaria sp. MPI-SDFR-AT-0083]